MGVFSMHLTEQPPQIAPQVFDRIGAPRALADVIDKALVKNRDQRWQTIDELADVDPAEAIDGLGDRFRDPPLVADVAEDRQRRATGGLDLGGRGVDRPLELRMGLVGLRDQGDVGAVASGAEGDREADAAAAAADQDRLALQAAGFGHAGDAIR